MIGWWWEWRSSWKRKEKREKKRAKDNAETQSAQRFRREEENRREAGEELRDSALGWALAGIRDEARNDASGLACCGYCYAEFFEFGAGGAFFFGAWITAHDFA